MNGVCGRRPRGTITGGSYGDAPFDITGRGQMSATERDRTDGQAKGTYAAPGTANDAIDIPGILASQIADLYASAERERRRATTERSIARAKRSA